jgi:uncharacterized protein (TIGR00369 family)
MTLPSDQRSPVFTWHHPFGELLGIQIKEVRPGYSLVTMEVTPHVMNPFHSVHGGATYALADTGMAMALYHQLDADQNCATVSIHMDYFHQIRKGIILAKSRVVHTSRRLANLECLLEDTDGKLLAKATGTFAIIAYQPPD